MVMFSLLTLHRSELGKALVSRPACNRMEGITIWNFVPITSLGFQSSGDRRPFISAPISRSYFEVALAFHII
jgi:hypothetical protein